MTTKTQTIGETLRQIRDGRPKAQMYNKLGVSAGTYDAWEADLYIPADEYGELLADHFGIPEREMVWLLYNARKLKSSMGVYLSSDLLPAA